MNVLSPKSWFKGTEGRASGKDTNFPRTRMRRNRSSEAMRKLVRENVIEPQHLILPLFVEEELSERTPIKSMPGVYRETEASIGAKETKELAVMVDTFYPLSLTKDALEFEKPEYQSTWLEGTGE